MTTSFTPAIGGSYQPRFAKSAARENPRPNIAQPFAPRTLKSGFNRISKQGKSFTFCEKRPRRPYDRHRSDRVKLSHVFIPLSNDRRVCAGLLPWIQTLLRQNRLRSRFLFPR